jgi:predicted amidophosphoribosyltransferase
MSKTPTELQSYMQARMEAEDLKRTAELNAKLGVCGECGKWALRHHSHCSQYGKPVDVAAQERCMEYGTGKRRTPGPGEGG